MCTFLVGGEPTSGLTLQVCPKDYLPSILKWVDPENLPRYLGGTSDATLIDDAGPWNDPQIRAEIEEDIAYRDGAAGMTAGSIVASCSSLVGATII